MSSFLPNRGAVCRTLAGWMAVASVSACAQHATHGGGQGGARPRPAPIVRQAPAARSQAAPAPIERRAPASVGNGPMSNSPAGNAAARNGGEATLRANPAANPKGHLNEWMSQHSNLTPAEQRLALEREPGFQRLPPQEQQRLRERFTQLEAMAPQQRQRMLAHNEAMERLSPDQRSQVRGAMQQLGSLPMDQRQSVARSFRELRQLPPEQRMAAMNSARYQNLNAAQRASLGNLLRVEPMLPPPEPPR